MTEPQYMVKGETVQAYGSALASLVALMLSRIARDKPGVSQTVATAYRKGDVRLRLVTTLTYGAQHELSLTSLDSRDRETILATVVVNATVLD